MNKQKSCKFLTCPFLSSSLSPSIPPYRALLDVIQAKFEGVTEQPSLPPLPSSLPSPPSLPP